MDVLYAHLHRAMAEPFVWGQTDCMLDLANYLKALTGYDCAARFRGKYDSALSCQRVSGFLTDPVNPAAECIAEFPLEVTTKPQRGDVGVISIVSDRKVIDVGGICLGRNWSTKAETGIVIGQPLKVLAAWKAPNA